MERNNFGLRPWTGITHSLTAIEIEPAQELDPYQKLLLAILDDAIETLRKGKPQVIDRYGVERRRYKAREGKRPLDPVGDAWNWLMSDEEESCLGFVAICQHFNWDHYYIRKKALEVIQKR